MGLLLAVGAAVLLSFNRFAVAVGLTVLALIASYPFMKRITYWPQFFLGLNFNWGALLGWAAVRGEFDWAPALLYLGGIAWTLGYDTIYAHQDKEDDLRIGVKSSALALGERTRPWLFAFYAGSVVLWAMAGRSAGLAWPYYLGLGIAGLQLAWQAARVDIGDPEDCLAKFRSNRIVGWALLLARSERAGLPVPDPADPANFVRANTAIASPPLVPEIRLHLAGEITPLWQATETSLARDQLPPPYWAFAWAGGQALARHILDHPELVRGGAVLDFGAGSGLVAIAAAKAGARVTAAEIDRFAAAAIALNAALNGVAVAIEAPTSSAASPRRGRSCWRATCATSGRSPSA